MKKLLAGLTGSVWAIWAAADWLPVWTLTQYADPAFMAACVLSLILAFFVWTDKGKIEDSP
jgi:hypothetical protein